MMHLLFIGMYFLAFITDAALSYACPLCGRFERPFDMFAAPSDI